MSFRLEKTEGSKAERQARMLNHTSTLHQFVVHINIVSTFENKGFNVNILP